MSWTRRFSWVSSDRAGRRAALCAEVERDLIALGRGPVRRQVRAADARTLVIDGHGTVVAVVGEWPATHRPGLITEARTPEGRRWTASAVAAA